MPGSPAMNNPRAFLRHLYDVAVARAQPSHVLRAHLPQPPRPGTGRTVVIGAGKASGAMAQALEAAWPADHPLRGTVLTRYGHVPPRPLALAGTPQRIQILEAGHPVPDEAGLQGTQAMLSQLQGLTAGDLVIALISGGGSALLTAPAPGCTLQDEQALHRQLLRCGATIGEMNAVRRHLSAIKGGRLAARCGPARLVTLAISDVPGDRLEDIASGPTVPDPSTCADALAVIDRFGISLPAMLMAALRAGQAGGLETLKPGDPVFAGHGATLIATPKDMLQAAAQAARQAGLRAHVLSDRIEGEARDVGHRHAVLALGRHSDAWPADLPGGLRIEPPCVLLSGGETTVTLNTPALDATGGRCRELLLSAALALQGQANIWMLAADTDGIDGHGPAAGALIDPDTLQRAQALGLDAQAMLAAHDAGRFFEALHDEILTGPTHTNVNDFRAVLVA
jgi:hydroxypyruvate reductase